ncbi:hypothetical protein [Nocardia sp. NBC_00881]|uniref:hypothetical protein n=1 Tax=Nocardia sp. NBC_00881 TaxID=2975995 RepID=UPI00386A88EC
MALFFSLPTLARAMSTARGIDCVIDARVDGSARDGDGWWGKGVRSALVLACAESAVPAAVAVELMHNASLIHDDLIV